MSNNKDYEHDKEVEPTLPAETSSDAPTEPTNGRKVVVVAPSPSRSKSSDNTSYPNPLEYLIMSGQYYLVYLH